MYLDDWTRQTPHSITLKQMLSDRIATFAFLFYLWEKELNAFRAKAMGKLCLRMVPP